MNRIVLVLLIASGCQSLAALRGAHPAEEQPPPVHAGITSIRIERDGAESQLKVTCWVQFPPGWRQNFGFELTGPGGHYALDGSSSLDGGEGVLSTWHDEWPAGDYKLAFYGFGKLVTTSEFTVAKLSTGRGMPYAMVVSTDRAMLYKSGSWVYTYTPVNVAAPAYGVQAVWVSNHRVVDSVNKVVEIASLFDMGRLGELVRVDLDSKQLATLDTATLMVFVNGVGLYGSWSWSKAQQIAGVALPSVTPDASDVSIARAAARKLAAENGSLGSSLVNPDQEALACAIASDEQARDAFAKHQHAAVNGSIDDHTADDETTVADNDDALTDRQRAKLRRSAAQHREDAGSAAQRQASGLAVAKKRSHKYKQGCLAAMGVPSLPALPTR